MAARAPVIRPPQLLNERVALRPEWDAAHRGAYELSPVSIVRWAQCPRCRRRFWYALSADTPREELWYHGAALRQRLLDEPCETHGGAAGVKVELFGVARLTAGERAVTLPHAEAASLRAIVRALAQRYPALVGPVIAHDGEVLNDGYLLNVNGRDFVRDLTTALQPGDAVLLVAAAAGG